MIYQNKAWREETGFKLSPTGEPLKPISKKEKTMELKNGEIIRFSAMDDFTGEDMELVGEVVGNHEAVKKQFPEEMAEVMPGYYLIKVGHRSGFFVIAVDEVLEVLGSKKKGT